MMKKSKRLNEQQRLFLSFVPSEFQGEQVTRLVYSALLYCSQCAVERGEDTFTIGRDGIVEMTGYKKTMVSPALRFLINNGYVEREKMGNGKSHRNSTYKVIQQAQANVNNGQVEVCKTSKTDISALTDTNNNVNNKYNSNGMVMDNTTLKKNSNMEQVIKDLIEGYGNTLNTFNAIIEGNEKEHRQELVTLDDRVSKVEGLLKDMEKKISTLESRIQGNALQSNHSNTHEERGNSEVIQTKKELEYKETGTPSRYDEINATFTKLIDTMGNKSNNVEVKRTAANQLIRLINEDKLTQRQTETACKFIDNFKKYELKQGNGCDNTNASNKQDFDSPETRKAMLAFQDATNAVRRAGNKTTKEQAEEFMRCVAALQDLESKGKLSPRAIKLYKQYGTEFMVDGYPFRSCELSTVQEVLGLK